VSWCPRPRFAIEPRESIGIAGDRGWKELQRDIAAQLRVGGTVDDAHSAFAQLVEDFVGADARSLRQHRGVTFCDRRNDDKEGPPGGGEAYTAAG
jgi:hypothetical protein